MPKRLILKGKVQGVLCRNFCSRYGRSLGLRGSASNLPDGSVEVLLNTEDEDLILEYINCIKTNPRKEKFWGKIESVDQYDYSGPIRGDYEF